MTSRSLKYWVDPELIQFYRICNEWTYEILFYFIILHCHVVLFFPAKLLTNILLQFTLALFIIYGSFNRLYRTRNLPLCALFFVTWTLMALYHFLCFIPLTNVYHLTITTTASFCHLSTKSRWIGALLIPMTLSVCECQMFRDLILHYVFQIFQLFFPHLSMYPFCFKVFDCIRNSELIFFLIKFKCLNMVMV